MLTPKEMEPQLKRWEEAIKRRDIRVEDEVAVEFVIRINSIAGSGKEGQIFGFTEDGMCVSAPISAIVERFPRKGNGGEPTDQGEVFGG